jgi:hypothetical protein
VHSSSCRPFWFCLFVLVKKATGRNAGAAIAKTRRPMKIPSIGAGFGAPLGMGE